MSKHIAQEMNRPTLSVGIFCCHDIGESGNALLATMNVEVYYDFVNNIDKLN